LPSSQVFQNHSTLFLLLNHQKNSPIVQLMINFNSWLFYSINLQANNIMKVIFRVVSCWSIQRTRTPLTNKRLWGEKIRVDNHVSTWLQLYPQQASLFCHNTKTKHMCSSWGGTHWTITNEVKEHPTLFPPLQASAKEGAPYHKTHPPRSISSGQRSAFTKKTPWYSKKF